MEYKPFTSKEVVTTTVTSALILTALPLIALPGCGIPIGDSYVLAIGVSFMMALVAVGGEMSVRVNRDRVFLSEGNIAVSSIRHIPLFDPLAQLVNAISLFATVGFLGSGHGRTAVIAGVLSTSITTVRTAIYWWSVAKVRFPVAACFLIEDSKIISKNRNLIQLPDRTISMRSGPVAEAIMNSCTKKAQP